MLTQIILAEPRWDGDEFDNGLHWLRWLRNVFLENMLFNTKSIQLPIGRVKSRNLQLLSTFSSIIKQISRPSLHIYFDEGQCLSNRSKTKRQAGLYSISVIIQLRRPSPFFSSKEIRFYARWEKIERRLVEFVVGTIKLKRSRTTLLVCKMDQNQHSTSLFSFVDDDGSICDEGHGM